MRKLEKKADQMMLRARALRAIDRTRDDPTAEEVRLCVALWLRGLHSASNIEGPILYLERPDLRRPTTERPQLTLSRF